MLQEMFAVMYILRIVKSDMGMRMGCKYCDLMLVFLFFLLRLTVLGAFCYFNLPDIAKVIYGTLWTMMNFGISTKASSENSNSQFNEIVCWALWVFILAFLIFVLFTLALLSCSRYSRFGKFFNINCS